MHKFLVINGPNLNFLGIREPQKYGSKSLESIKKDTEHSLAGEASLEWFQSNVEGELVNRIQELSQEKEFSGLVINPGAYSHTSIAILDALSLLNIPIVEVHLSQIYKREPFRQVMLTAQAAHKIMTGLGENSYYMAVLSMLKGIG